MPAISVIVPVYQAERLLPSARALAERAGAYREAYRALEEAGELDKLPGKLRETALLRRENPEATLQELAAMLNPPITKSAINHRMRKLLELARALEE